jgi:ubiquinone/menaquinone biosynthesis C-methylase UbiE
VSQEIGPNDRWVPSAAYARISEANREYYARNARQYDATETCVVDDRFQAGLRRDLDESLELIGKPLESIAALDACGGSGNVALKLMERGVYVVLVDISPDLQTIFRTRCEERGWKPTIVCSEVSDYLAKTNERFDLITFSSALHHLHSYEKVLELALDRLSPGGLLFTTFDPTLRRVLPAPARMLLACDYYAFKILRQTGDFPSAIRRRAMRVMRGVSARNKDGVRIDHTSAGMLAEYHVERGIDDTSLVRFLEGCGAEVVWHRRFADARFGLTRHLLHTWGAATTFKLLVRRRSLR